MLRGRRLLLSRRSVCYLSEESAVGTGRDTCRGRGTSDAHRGLEQDPLQWTAVGAQKGVYADDLDAELERLYAEHVAPPRKFSRVGAPGSRAMIRSYCSQVWKAARLWKRIRKSMGVAEFAFPGDPMRIVYSYRRNGTRG